MKSTLKNIIGVIIAGGLSLTACNDWTEPSPFDVNNISIEEQNPELYAKYLENLRAYRQTEHQLVYGWFDNSEKKPYSRAHHLTDIPDSIDVVGLMYPDQLVQFELDEINEIRSKKGMKVIYSIDFDNLKSTYNDMVDNAPEDEPVSVEFRQFLMDTVSYSLSLAAKYQYDGICINYRGKSHIHMTDVEKKEYKENENCFIGMVNDWLERNPGMALSFQGQPENLFEGKYILDKCNVILIPGTEAKSTSELSKALSLSYFLEYGEKYGATMAIDGDLSASSFATWASALHNGKKLKAIGLYNIAKDYYSSGKNYSNVRDIISVVNPSIK